MPLTEEQIKSVKEQLLKQVANFPQEKRKQAEEYIKFMNSSQLEEFLAKNKLLKQQEGQGSKEKEAGKCVYCNLANKIIESLPIYEDKDYLAVLEINPYSKGHAIIIPKRHIENAKALKARALTTTRKVGKFIIRKLKAEDFQITTSDELGHAIVNIIPVYKDVPLTYERKPADKKELQELSMKIGKLEKKTRQKKEKKIEIEKEKITPNIIKFSRRIP